ncbi:MAG: hypothetical protein PVF96_00025 [Candidatus Bathyarchaeota archaeon]
MNPELTDKAVLSIVEALDVIDENGHLTRLYRARDGCKQKERLPDEENSWGKETEEKVRMPKAL